MIEDGERRPGVFYKDGKIDHYECQDCKQRDITYFMVKDEVWEASGVGKGIICPQCFEARLGRKLTIQDFKKVPSNNEIFYGYELAQSFYIKRQMDLLRRIMDSDWGKRVAMEIANDPNRDEWREKMESSGHPFVVTSRKQSAHAGEEIIAEGLTFPDYPPCEFIEEHFTILDPEDKKEKE